MKRQLLGMMMCLSLLVTDITGSCNMAWNAEAKTVTDKTSKSGRLRFYDEQSKKWYIMEVQSNVKRHNFDWSNLSGKKNNIKYRDKNYKTRRGVDVSYHNGTINWKKVKKSGIDFAFIRLGYRGYGQSGTLQIDKQFKRNLKNAKKAGIDVGVYFFSQAISKKEAIREANLVIETLHGEQLDLPVVYDPERVLGVKARTDGMSGKQLTRNTITFCEKIEKAGYHPMVYSNLYSEAFLFNMEKVQKYPIWYADYKKKPQTPYDFSVWQYTSSGTVDGISGRVDMNLQFIPL